MNLDTWCVTYLSTYLVPVANPGQSTRASSLQPTFAGNSSVPVTQTESQSALTSDTSVITSATSSEAQSGSETGSFDPTTGTLTDQITTSSGSIISSDALTTSTGIIEPPGRPVIFLISVPTPTNDKTQTKLFIGGVPFFYDGEDYKELAAGPSPPAGAVTRLFTAACQSLQVDLPVPTTTPLSLSTSTEVEESTSSETTEAAESSSEESTSAVTPGTTTEAGQFTAETTTAVEEITTENEATVEAATTTDTTTAVFTTQESSTVAITAEETTTEDLTTTESTNDTPTTTTQINGYTSLDEFTAESYIECIEACSVYVGCAGIEFLKSSGYCCLFNASSGSSTDYDIALVEPYSVRRR
ncbi:uncharacterized protein FPRN_12236 [Fusarium proliferatum]|nr:uncharacterized protein FPRN_12236 [Fusarium proliferatum]